MMSACNMLSENTGHGVRTTHRTNALIRPGSAAAEFTNPPYRAAVTRRKLTEESGKSRRGPQLAGRSQNCRETMANRYLSAVITSVNDDVRGVYAAGRPSGGGV
ncbi:hypothetical protein MKUB_35160 [Mycobacterium kubicae]|uniref:Transposase n=1 Tax=Mycobacterium kubicae TaxID=120959 RepID=A0ABQ1BQQ9_9MYCO|nr:hypothetical protein MKUB_35160 [Mycobacterium kubicae]